METVNIAHFIQDIQKWYAMTLAGQDDIRRPEKEKKLSISPYFGEMEHVLINHEGWLLKAITSGQVDYTGFSRELFSTFQEICTICRANGHKMQKVIDHLEQHLSGTSKG